MNLNLGLVKTQSIFKHSFLSIFLEILVPVYRNDKTKDKLGVAGPSSVIFEVEVMAEEFLKLVILKKNFTKFSCILAIFISSWMGWWVKYQDQ